jgi:hypothetical protein
MVFPGFVPEHTFAMTARTDTYPIGSTIRFHIITYMYNALRYGEALGMRPIQV